MGWILRVALGCLLLVTVASSEADAGTGTASKGKSDYRSIHTFESVQPYLAHALRDCRCHQISDAFDKRACKKGCVSFKKKMLKWAAKNPMLHQSLKFHVEEYNFRSRSFTLSHTNSLMPEVRYGRIDQDGVIIGKSRCESVDGELTSMVETKLQLKAKMKESEAKKSVLRGAGRTDAVVILKGKPTSVTWCCGAFMRREFAMDKAPCSSRAFRFSVKEIAIGIDPTVDPKQEPDEETHEETQGEQEPGSWKQGFKTAVAPIEFTPGLIGFKDVPGDLD